MLLRRAAGVGSWSPQPICGSWSPDATFFVEATSRLLPPIKEKYQEIDRAASRPRISESVQIGAVEILLTPFRLLLAPWLLLSFMARP